MKKILLVVLVSVLLFSCSEKEIKRYHVDEIVSPRDSLIYLKKDMSLITGVVCDSSRGSIILEFNVKNGLKVGNYKQWYKGQLEKRLNFKKGYWHGLYQEWYENGQLKIESNYTSGNLDGLYREWYDNGQLKSERNFKDGKEGEKSREWYSDGILKQKIIKFNSSY